MRERFRPIKKRTAGNGESRESRTHCENLGIKTGRQTLSRQDKVRETERLKEKFERERRPETANYGILAHLASTLG